MVRLSKELTALLSQVGDIEQLVSESVANVVNVEYSNSQLFIGVYTLYNSTKADKRVEVTRYLNELVGGATSSTNIINQFKKIFKQAKDYVDFSVVAKLKYLEYTNINKIVMLLRYVNKHKESELSKVKLEITKVYTKDMSPHRYNNSMTDKLQDLKEEHKLKEVEGDFIFIEFLDVVKTNVNKLDESQLDELMIILQERLDIVETNRLQVA